MEQLKIKFRLLRFTLIIHTDSIWNEYSTSTCRITMLISNHAQYFFNLSWSAEEKSRRLIFSFLFINRISLITNWWSLAHSKLSIIAAWRKRFCVVLIPDRNPVPRPSIDSALPLVRLLRTVVSILICSWLNSNWTYGSETQPLSPSLEVAQPLQSSISPSLWKESRATLYPLRFF